MKWWFFEEKYDQSSYFMSTFAILQEMFGTKEFLPHTAWGELVLSKFRACSKTCKSILSMLFGFNWNNVNMVCANKSAEGPWCPSEGQCLDCPVSWSQVKPVVKCPCFPSEPSWCVCSTFPSRDFSTKRNPLVAGKPSQILSYAKQSTGYPNGPLWSISCVGCCNTSEVSLLGFFFHPFIKCSAASWAACTFSSRMAPKEGTCKEKRWELRTLHPQQGHFRALISD